MSRSQLQQQRKGIQVRKEIMPEAKWKEQDHAPIIPPFTVSPGVQVEFSKEPSCLEFLNAFFDDDLVTQTNLYEKQYRDANSNLSCICRAKS